MQCAFHSANPLKINKLICVGCVVISKSKNASPALIIIRREVYYKFVGATLHFRYSLQSGMCPLVTSVKLIRRKSDILQGVYILCVATTFLKAVARRLVEDVNTRVVENVLVILMGGALGYEVLVQSDLM